MNTTQSPAGQQLRPFGAAISMIAAMVILGFVDNYIALIAQEVSIWQFLLMRFVMAIPLIWALSYFGLGGLRPKRFWAVVLRSALIALGIMLYFGSLAFMPIAQSLAGLFTSPIFVLLITAFVLKQPIGPWRIVAVIIGFSGILMVLGLHNGFPGWIMLMPVMGGLIYAMGSVATRVLCADESTVCMLAGIMTFQAIIGTISLLALQVIQPEVGAGGNGFLLRPWVWPGHDVLIYIAMQAVFSVAGVFFLIRAYQWGEASQVSVLEYSIMIFGPFFAWLLMDQNITLSMGIGIVLIMIAGGIIAIRSKE